MLSEISSHKYSLIPLTCSTFDYCRYSTVVKFIETESKMGAAGELGGGEMGSCYLIGTEF